MGSPVLPNAFNFEDGFLASGSIVVDTLKSKSMTDAGVNGESTDREVVKVPFEIAVLEVTSSGEILLHNRMFRRRYLIIPRLKGKLGPTLPQM